MKAWMESSVYVVGANAVMVDRFGKLLTTI
jgi:hypothetical protein